MMPTLWVFYNSMYFGLAIWFIYGLFRLIDELIEIKELLKEKKNENQNDV